ncbi:hypothetical protein GCM10022223_22430 [Kineosporia mesophila]|uniref:Branched-chain amino acid ABC transporter permease n=1 Tax=Kineosporia mesophila TaxID=566012 RepID=A0ABP6ZG71_9ACTN
MGPERARAIALVCAADTLVAVSFGAIAVGGGLDRWVPVVLSLLVFAGGAQFAAVGTVLAGGSATAAVVTGLLLNARLLPFSFSVSDMIRGGPLRRALGAQIVTDETVALALAERDPARRAAVFWACGVALFVCWNIGVVAGAVAGTWIGDTDALGLDAAFPAVLVAIVLPALNTRRIRASAGIGSLVAVVSTPLLPAGLPVLASLAGLVALVRRPDRAHPDRAPGPSPLRRARRWASLMPILAVLVLAAGTFAFRIAGPALAGRYEFSERAQAWMASAATTLLAALIATSTLIQDGSFAGWARFTGVSLAVVLVLFRAPFPLVVIAAAVTTAALRQLGVA